MGSGGASHVLLLKLGGSYVGSYVPPILKNQIDVVYVTICKHELFHDKIKVNGKRVCPKKKL